MFRFYTTRHFILAFKFMRKKRFQRNGGITYEHRKLIEYYKVADMFDAINDIPCVKCTYEGKTFAIHGKKSVKLICLIIKCRFKDQHQLCKQNLLILLLPRRQKKIYSLPKAYLVANFLILILVFEG